MGLEAGLKEPKTGRFSGSVNVNGRIQRQNIGKCSKTGDLAAADWSDQRSVPEFLAGVNIGEMNFDGGDADGGDGIPKSDAGMGVGGGVDNEDAEATFGLLDPSDQLSFEVGLSELDLGSRLERLFPDLSLDFSQSGMAVNLWLPLAEQVQVRPVEEEDSHSVPKATVKGSRGGVDWILRPRWPCWPYLKTTSPEASTS